MPHGRRPLTLNYNWTTRTALLTLPHPPLLTWWTQARVVKLLQGLDPRVKVIATIEGGEPAWLYLRVGSKWHTKSLDPIFSTFKIENPAPQPPEFQHIEDTTTWMNRQLAREADSKRQREKKRA